MLQLGVEVGGGGGGGVGREKGLVNCCHGACGFILTNVQHTMTYIYCCGITCVDYLWHFSQAHSFNSSEHLESPDIK